MNSAGAAHSYFGKDEFAQFAPGMKTMEDSRYIRDKILSSFEMAELATDPVERAEWLTFVVVGAGPTGVELVGQIAELAHKVLPREFWFSPAGPPPRRPGRSASPPLGRDDQSSTRPARPPGIAAR